MKTNLRMKCPYCGCWNRFPVNKIFIEQPGSEPKVKVLVPMYEPLEVVKCNKCGNGHSRTPILSLEHPLADISHL